MLLKELRKVCENCKMIIKDFKISTNSIAHHTIYEYDEVYGDYTVLSIAPMVETNSGYYAYPYIEVSVCKKI